MLFSKVLVPMKQNYIHKVWKMCFLSVPEVYSLNQRGVK